MPVDAAFGGRVSQCSQREMGCGQAEKGAVLTGIWWGAEIPGHAAKAPELGLAIALWRPVSHSAARGQAPRFTATQGLGVARWPAPLPAIGDGTCPIITASNAHRSFHKAPLASHDFSQASDLSHVDITRALFLPGTLNLGPKGSYAHNYYVSIPPARTANRQAG